MAEATCQRCGHILRVSDSLLDLNASAFDFLQDRETLSRSGVAFIATPGASGYTTPPHSAGGVTRTTSHEGIPHLYNTTRSGSGGRPHGQAKLLPHPAASHGHDLPTVVEPLMGRRVVRQSPQLAPSESFVMLTQSQVADAWPVAQREHETAGVRIAPLPGTAAGNVGIDQGTVAGPHAPTGLPHNSISHRLRVIDMLTRMTLGNIGDGSESGEERGKASPRSTTASDCDEYEGDGAQPSTDSVLGRLEHPLCQECTDLTLDIMSRQLAELTSERDRYAEFLARLGADQVDNVDTSALDQELEALNGEGQTYQDVIAQMEQQLSTTQSEVAALEKEAASLDELERSRWEEYNAYETQLHRLNDERDSLELSLKQASDWVEKLQRANVYNDAFHISHDGPFGTINGFRLGRLPSHPVEWQEINAAWGLTVLLLQTLCDKLHFQLKTYKLVPLGSYSRIDRVEGEKAQYELYGSGEFHFGRLLQNRRFDHGMVAFLDCLQQLGEFAERQDDKLKLPYRQDRIGDACIRLRYNQEDMWTRALKYALTNTKWLLAFACSSARRQ